MIVTESHPSARELREELDDSTEQMRYLLKAERYRPESLSILGEQVDRRKKTLKDLYGEDY